MASYLDEIPKFREYVPQLPVEAMAKVGMYKQQKYEENVTKIQKQIDDIAGLDVYRDVDKQYLQSKLDELGGNLRTFAAGDFSNFQLVNSVSGMTNQVVKDRNVQNSVNSTAWYRKQQKAIEEAKKNGKSDIANEDLFYSQVNKWNTNPNVGVSFSDEFIPYTDVFKKLQEIAKSVGEDSTIVQQLFQTDGNGNPKLVNGKLQYNDVMAETLLKGKDKDKILNAFQTGLDSNDYRQLNITGRYQFKGKSAEDISRMLNDGFLEYQKSQLVKKDIIQDKILELKTKGGSKEDIDALTKAVANIDLGISKRKSQIEETLKSNDTDAIKGSIYTNNYLDSIASSFSKKDTYTKYSKNPAVEMLLDREKLKLQQNEFKLNQDKFRYEQTHDKEVMDQEIWKALFEKGLVDEKGKPTGAGLFSGAARDIPVTDKTNPLYFSDQFEQGLKDDMTTQFSLYEKVAVADWMSKNSGKINPTTGKAFTNAEMKAEMAKWAGKVGMSYNDYVVLQGQKATDRYNKTKGKAFGAEYIDDFNSINELGNRIGISKKKMDNEKSFIAANAQGFTPVDLSKIDIKPTNVLAVIGGEAEGMGKMRRQNVTLSKQDVFDFAKFIYHDWEGGFVPGAFDSELIKNQAKEAKDRLVKKYGTAGFESIQRSLRGREKFDPSDMNPFNMVINAPSPENLKQNEEIKKAINIIKNDSYRKTMVLKEQYYKGMTEVGVPKAVVLFKDKAEQKEHLQSALASVVSDYSGIDDSYQDIAKSATDEKSQFQINIDPAASRYGNNSYSLQVTNADGTIITKPITEKHYEFLTGKTPPSLLINEILSSIKSSDYNCTNLTHMYTDDDAHTTAFIKDNQTRTKNYNVAMDFAPGANNLLFPKIYVQTSDDSFKLIPYNVGLTPEDAKNFPSLVDDVFIKSLLQSK